MSKTYAFTDIHGQYKLWEKIKKHCAEDDVIYFLGDAVDRGPDGIKIMLELLADPRVIYLKGNHEDMMVEVCRDIIKELPSDLHWWLENGGYSTYESLAPDLYSNNENLLAFLDKIDKLPTCALYQNRNGENIYLSHSGAYSPIFEEKFSKWVKEASFDHKYLWDRSHINRKTWSEKYPNAYIVHGHSPVQLFFKKEEPHEYCEGHKIDLDLGTYNTKQIALLDLDTFDCTIFDDK